MWRLWCGQLGSQRCSTWISLEVLHLGFAIVLDHCVWRQSSGKLVAVRESKHHFWYEVRAHWCERRWCCEEGAFLGLGLYRPLATDLCDFIWQVFSWFFFVFSKHFYIKGLSYFLIQNTIVHLLFDCLVGVGILCLVKLIEELKASILQSERKQLSCLNWVQASECKCKQLTGKVPERMRLTEKHLSGSNQWMQAMTFW